MPQRLNSKHPARPLMSRQRCRQRLRELGVYGLTYGITWLGGMSLLSGGMGFAQTEGSVDPAAVPSAQDLLMPAPVAPAPEPVPTVVAPDPVEVIPVVPAASAPRSESAPIPEESPAVQSSPISLPSDVADQVETLTPQPALVNPDSDGVGDRQGDGPMIDSGVAGYGRGNYIDSTPDYSLGATPAEHPTVVISERSTGCQVVLQTGQNVPAQFCTAGHTAAIAQSSGFQPRSPIGSVRVGSLQLSSNGIGLARDYFSLTQRPSSLLGNGNTRLMFPLSIPVAITSAFGWRIHPITGTLRFHYGTDLGAPMGTPVIAAYTGQVAIADFMQGYGLTVVLRHATPTAETLYGHLSEIFVQPGDRVEQGQVIGRVGSTGNSTGPHLHFEFRERTSEGWVALNPGMLLTQALANFNHYLQPPSPSSPSVLAFGLTSFDKVLTALKQNPQSLQFQPIQVSDPAIAPGIQLADIKDWTKIKAKAQIEADLKPQTAPGPNAQAEDADS